MPKRIDVLTVKVTVHIALDRADAESVIDAYGQSDDLLAYCSKQGRQASREQRTSRVPAWPAADVEPIDAVDGLDIPDGLRRVPAPGAAE